MTDEVAGNTGSRGLLARVHELLGDHLQQVEAVYVQELQSRHPFVREILDHLANYRGKRLRPILLLLAADACGSLNHAHHVLAAVLEMIHTATLVHDDILDEATTRRHVATVNSRWSNETSVLLGDYLFTHAFHLTSSLGNAAACRTIGRATNIVCEGEMWQVGERGNLDLTEDQYLHIVEGKTAELTAVACSLGAHFAGASADVEQALDGYGRSLGIAFQIADDLLDVVGSEQLTGKTLGSDLQKQKLTLPVIHMLSQLEPADAEQVRELLAHPDGRTRSSLHTWLERTGGIAYARNRATGFVLAAQQHLAVLPSSPAKTLLEDIAEFSMQRSA